VRTSLPIALAAALSGAIVTGHAAWSAGPAPASPAGPVVTPIAQSDLDAFMAKVLAKRDENWKKLQQYILDEREEVVVRGPGGLPVWGERREYTWFIREGYFIRSPLTANGVKLSETDRRKYEDDYLRRARARDKRAAERERRKSGETVEPERIPEEAPTFDALLSQTRRPQFVDSAYFMNFKFEEGRYALVGREPFEGTQEVLRIEYYPAKLFGVEPGEERKQRAEVKPGERDRGADYGATIERLMNKVSLVTIWVEPASHQIVKYTFDNVNFDFLPAAWLVRLDDLKASMTMSRPFKDIWLPKNIDFFFSAMLAVGPFSARYHIDYADYREATTAARIKKADGGR